MMKTNILKYIYPALLCSSITAQAASLTANSTAQMPVIDGQVDAEI